MSPSTAVEQQLLADAVAGNDDLLGLILLRLPSKSRTRSKIVCKHWLSLISDLQRSLFFKPTTALFLQSFGPDPELTIVPLNDNDSAFNSPEFEHLGQPNTRIKNSSNGLICYSKYIEYPDRNLIEYFVFNPTTNRSSKIPVHGTHRRRNMGCFGGPTILYKLCFSNSGDGDQQIIRVLGVYVAFDPLRLTRYRVICVSECGGDIFNIRIRIAVYKPELASWSEQFGPFTVPSGMDYSNGVFWNGVMFWATKIELACFFLAGEYLKVAAMPTASRTSVVDYFGVSRDHLMAIVCQRPWDGALKVFEMGKDYTGWVYRYQCDIQPLIDGMVDRDVHSSFPLVFVARGNEEDESFLILGVSDGVVCYSLKSKTWKTISDYPSVKTEISAWRVGFQVFPFDRTLCDV